MQSTRVSCQGEKEEIGHPLIYLDLSKTGEATCPYCSSHFKLETKKTK